MGLFIHVSNYPMHDWLSIVTTGVSSATLITAFFVVRKISRLEFMVETMWGAFTRRFGESEFPRRVISKKGNHGSHD